MTKEKSTDWTEWDLVLYTFPDPFWHLLGRETTKEEEEEALEQFWYEMKKINEATAGTEVAK